MQIRNFITFEIRFCCCCIWCFIELIKILFIFRLKEEEEKQNTISVGFGEKCSAKDEPRFTFFFKGGLLSLAQIENRNINVSIQVPDKCGTDLYRTYPLLVLIMHCTYHVLNVFRFYIMYKFVY